MCILILGIGCTTNETTLQEETKTEQLTKEKAIEIVLTVKGECKICRANCQSTGIIMSEGVNYYQVACDNGHEYSAWQNNDGTWNVSCQSCLDEVIIRNISV